MPSNQEYLAKNELPVGVPQRTQSELLMREDEDMVLALDKPFPDALTDIKYAIIPEGETSRIWAGCYGRIFDHHSL